MCCWAKWHCQTLKMINNTPKVEGDTGISEPRVCVLHISSFYVSSCVVAIRIDLGSDFGDLITHGYFLSAATNKTYNNRV